MRTPPVLRTSSIFLAFQCVITNARLRQDRPLAGTGLLMTVFVPMPVMRTMAETKAENRFSRQP